MWKPPSAIWATCFRMVVVAITLLLLAVVRPGASSESCCQFSLQSTSLSRYAARCSQLAFGQLWWHGNGPTKKWIFKSISTNWQWHKFIFIGGSSMPWWNWEMIQRNGRKVIKRPWRKPSNESVCDVRTRATNQVRRADQWQRLYDDNLFNKTGSTTLNSFELLDIFGHIRLPRCSGILQVGTN